MVGRDKVLQPVFRPLYRPAQPDRREGDQEIFRIKFPAYAKSPTDVAFDKVHLLFGEVQKRRQYLPVKVGYFGGSPNRQFSRVVGHYHSPGFQRVAGVAVGLEAFFAGIFGVSKRLIDIAGGDNVVRRQVGSRRLVDDNLIPQRLFDVNDGLQRFIGHVYDV